MAQSCYPVPGLAIRTFSSRIRNAWQRLRPQPRFRDPAADFHVALTPPEALAAPPPRRHPAGPYLFQHGSYLSLHLGGSTTDGVHATMDSTAPADLVFSYTRIMAAFSHFVPEPATIGMVGLGGGSLAKHCYLQFPQSNMLVAEISPAVIALRRIFLVPDDDARFSVLPADGVDFVREHRNTFDVLLIDAFDEHGHLPRFGTRAFYRQCHRALTPGGVLVLNFSGDTWQPSRNLLGRVFQGQAVLYRCPDGDNVIAFATRAPLPAWARQAPGDATVHKT